MGEIGTAPAGTASEGTSEPRAGGGRASPKERAHRRSPPALNGRVPPAAGAPWAGALSGCFCPRCSEGNLTKLPCRLGD